MSAKDITVAFKCDKDFYESLTRLCKESGQSKGDVIRGCIVEGHKVWLEKQRAKDGKPSDIIR